MAGRVCQLVEPSDENTLSLLMSFLKDREAKRRSLQLDLAQRGDHHYSFIIMLLVYYKLHW